MSDAIEQTGIEIVQAVPGKMQLRVPRLSDNATLAQQLEQLALKTAGVTSIHVDRSTASVVITHKSDAATTERLRSRLADLMPHRSLPQLERPIQQQKPPTASPTGKRDRQQKLPQSPSPHKNPVIADLQQQIAALQQQLAAYSDYDSLRQKCQQQSRLIASLQQQLADLQHPSQNTDIPRDTELRQLRRLATMGEWQLNKWQRRLR
ncbi:MAG: hypothetical protein ACFB4I_16550 [Cyanophyceae cyanobacterium]